MLISEQGNHLKIKKQEGDRFYTESALYNAVKKALNLKGHDLVKRRAWQDGIMFGGDELLYLRDRKKRYCFIDLDYAINELAQTFNRMGFCSLTKR